MDQRHIGETAKKKPSGQPADTSKCRFQPISTFRGSAIIEASVKDEYEPLCGRGMENSLKTEVVESKVSDGISTKIEDSSIYPMIAGGFSQGCAHFFGQPMDVLRTQMVQQQMGGGKVQSALHITRDIYRDKGIPALWRGASVAVTRVAVGGAIYFSAQHRLLEIENKMYGDGKKQDKSSKEKKRTQPILHTMVIGGVARSVASILCCPISVIKTRREAASGVTARKIASQPYRGALHMAWNIMTKESPLQLFSGLGPSLMRDAPYAGIYLSIYVQVKKITESSSVSGATAGTLATCLTHPPDVIRTHMQLVAAENGPDARAAGMFRVGADLFRSHGLKGIFRGLMVKCAKRAFTGAFGWLLYEEVMLLYGKRTHL
eukprot:g6365.t1